MLAVLAAGAGTGWLLRERDRTLDTDRLLDELGPSVVRVHGSTCGGSGRGTGVVIGPNRVLTATSVVRAPVAVAVEAADGTVRLADVEGVDASGVAVLRIPGAPWQVPAVPLAAVTPAGGDLAMVGFTATGSQAVTRLGAAPAGGGDLATLADPVDAWAVGAPVLDRGRSMVGLVTATAAGGTQAVGLSALRELAAGTRQVRVERPPSTCTEAKGPQTPVVPELAGQTGKLAEESAAALGEYLTAINRHDPDAIVATFTGRLEGQVNRDGLKAQYRTAYLFGPVVRSIRADGEGADVRMTSTLLQWNDTGPQGLRCARYDVLYDLARVGSRLRIEFVSSGLSGTTSYQACDGS